MSPHTHTCRGAHTASCHVCQRFAVASVPDSALSASSLPVIYLQAFLTFPLAFPSFLPYFLLFLFQLFSFLSNISASCLFFALLLRVSLLCPFCPVVSFLPSFFLVPLVFMSIFSHLLFIHFSFIFPSSSLTSFLSHALVYILLPLHPPLPLPFLPVLLNSPSFSLYYFIFPSPLLSDFYLMVKSMRQRQRG